MSELRFCGPSALNLLARFTDGNTDIDKLCNEIATKRVKMSIPTRILGEISHIPNSRSINVLHRKPWHKCSIEYLSPCENKTEILPISDLWIHIESGVIRLYSKTLKKYIVPRISSAHNHHNNLRCALSISPETFSHSTTDSLTFYMGKSGKPFLPTCHDLPTRR